MKWWNWKKILIKKNQYETLNQPDYYRIYIYIYIYTKYYKHYFSVIISTFTIVCCPTYINRKWMAN